MNKKLVSNLPEFYQDYIKLAKNKSSSNPIQVYDALAYSFDQAFDLFSIIYPEQKNYRYAEGKWTIAEVLGHLIDADRISAYRALRISRNDQQNQPGWNQEEFAIAANYQLRSFESIKQELLCTMESTGHLFEGLSKEQLIRVGYANHHAMSAEIVGLICAGHRLHHFFILKERYL